MKSKVKTDWTRTVKTITPPRSIIRIRARLKRLEANMIRAKAKCGLEMEKADKLYVVAQKLRCKWGDAEAKYEAFKKLSAQLFMDWIERRTKPKGNGKWAWKQAIGIGGWKAGDETAAETIARGRGR